MGRGMGGDQDGRVGDVYNNQGCTGRSTWGWVGGEKKRSGWNLHPEEGTQRRGYHRLRDPPCGVSASSHILATPSPGLRHQQDRSTYPV